MRQIRRASSPALAPRVLRSTEGGKPIARLVGYASVLYNAADDGTEYVMRLPWGDTITERIMPGAYDSILASKPDVRCLFNHNMDSILGRTTSGTLTLTADRVGLRFEARVDPSSPAVQSVLSAVERGDVSGSSFSFDFGEVVWREINHPDGSEATICEVHSFSHLFDVGPVVAPAYRSATCEVEGKRSVPVAPRSQPYVPGRRLPRCYNLPADPARRRALTQSRLIELSYDK
jgi:HK97 family phage prohead protease